MSRQIDSQRIGKSIKRLRLSRNWTQDYLAENIGYSVRNLRRIENAGTTNIEVVNAFAELFHQFIRLHEQRNLRVAGEMRVADILRSYQTRQMTRCFKNDTIIEHLNLYLCADDAVVAVANRIDY